MLFGPSVPWYLNTGASKGRHQNFGENHYLDIVKIDGRRGLSCLSLRVNFPFPLKKENSAVKIDRGLGDWANIREKVPKYLALCQLLGKNQYF